MKYLFGTSAQKIMREFIDKDVLLAFDFDGTLSPIVAKPHEAKLPAKTKEKLQSLADRFQVAVISGRKSDDVQQRLGFDPAFLIGNHGVEGLPSWRKQMTKIRHICERWRSQIESKAAQIPLHSGVFLENKTYSLALHYRNTSRKHLVRKKLLEMAIYLNPLPRIVTGKAVLNLVPEGIPHKGIALLELMKLAGAKKALYVGDDDTDEDIFRMKHPDLMTIRVGAKRDTCAKYYLKRQGEMNRLLDLLLEAAEVHESESKDSTRRKTKTLAGRKPTPLRSRVASTAA